MTRRESDGARGDKAKGESEKEEVLQKQNMKLEQIYFLSKKNASFLGRFFCSIAFHITNCIM